MTTTIKIDANHDAARVVAAINKLYEAGKHPRPAFIDIGEMMLLSIDQRFTDEEDPDGNPWEPLSKRTLKRKRNPKILTESTRYRSSFVYEADDDGLEIGTNVIYAAIHHFGGEIKKSARNATLAFNKKGRFASRKSTSRRRAGAVRVAFAQIAAHTIKIPARPVLGISAADETRIFDILERHLFS